MPKKGTYTYTKPRSQTGPIERLKNTIADDCKTFALRGENECKITAFYRMFVLKHSDMSYRDFLEQINWLEVVSTPIEKAISDYTIFRERGK